MTKNTYEIIKNMKLDPKNPNNIRLYHGTTHLGGENIPREGFQFMWPSNWNCSDEEQAYFYELKRFIECECLEDDSFTEQQYRILQRANESAQIQEAMLDQPMYYTYVLELIVPPEFAPFIQEDDSCENMDEAVQIGHDLINTLLKENFEGYALHVYRFDFCPKCAMLYISGLVDNPLFSAAFTSQELVIINALHTSVAFCEELIDVEPQYLTSWGNVSELNVYRND